MEHKIVNGKKVPLTGIDKAQRAVDLDKWESEAQERALEQFQKERIQAYPSIGEQLDLLYHEGLDAWKAKIKEVKDNIPKP